MKKTETTCHCASPLLLVILPGLKPGMALAPQFFPPLP